MEFAKTDLDRKALEVFLAPQSFGFPFAAPPDMNPATVKVLRDAFAAMTKDPEFKADIERQRLTLEPRFEADSLAIVSAIAAFAAKVRLEIVRAGDKPDEKA